MVYVMPKIIKKNCLTRVKVMSECKVSFFETQCIVLVLVHEKPVTFLLVFVFFYEKKHCVTADSSFAITNYCHSIIMQ